MWKSSLWMRKDKIRCTRNGVKPYCNSDTRHGAELEDSLSASFQPSSLFCMVSNSNISKQHTLSIIFI